MKESNRRAACRRPSYSVVALKVARARNLENSLQAFGGIVSYQIRVRAPAPAACEMRICGR